ncbi:MAG: hypothetical protein NC206_06260 [Bacteroides sp.]|nr:hypothetical protein [Roseburia sp.]MCM1346671.1 hypothetical protein [Bacteroides sp.]MCM1422139.1 hypothetical protein [Bacteroides sp.]
MDERIMIWTLAVIGLCWMFVMRRLQAVRNERRYHKFIEIGSVDEELEEYAEDDDD